MTTSIQDVMTPNPISVDESDSLRDVAVMMRDHGVGDVIVLRNGQVGGILTDRDIVVRAIAEGEDPGTAQAGDVCSGDMVWLAPDDTLETAAQVMSDAAVRRLPVVDDGRPLGIVSLGDLAVHREPHTALADISATPPNE